MNADPRDLDAIKAAIAAELRLVVQAERDRASRALRDAVTEAQFRASMTSDDLAFLDTTGVAL